MSVTLNEKTPSVKHGTLWREVHPPGPEVTRNCAFFSLAGKFCPEEGSHCWEARRSQNAPRFLLITDICVILDLTPTGEGKEGF